MKPKITIDIEDYERLTTIEKNILSGEKKIVVNVGGNIFNKGETSIYFLDNNEFEKRLSDICDTNAKLMKENELAEKILLKISMSSCFKFRKWRKQIRERTYDNLMARWFHIPIRWFLTNEIEVNE